MSTIIDNQNVSLNQIVLPIGTGIASNTSSSLTPLLGSLAIDASDSKIYSGSGLLWSSISNGVTSAASYSVNNVNFDLAGQTGISGKVTLTYISAAGNVGAQVMLSVDINSSITVTTIGNWASAANIIPVLYRPSAGSLYFPCIVNGSVGGLQNTYFQINSSGTGGIIIHSPQASGTMGWYTVSCVYDI